MGRNPTPVCLLFTVLFHLVVAPAVRKIKISEKTPPKNTATVSQQTWWTRVAISDEERAAKQITKDAEESKRFYCWYAAMQQTADRSHNVCHLLPRRALGSGLAPALGPDLHNFLKRSDAAGDGDSAVGERIEEEAGRLLQGVADADFRLVGQAGFFRAQFCQRIVVF